MKETKSMSFKNACIDISDMTITETVNYPYAKANGLVKA